MKGITQVRKLYCYITSLVEWSWILNKTGGGATMSQKQGSKSRRKKNKNVFTQNRRSLFWLNLRRINETF